MGDFTNGAHECFCDRQYKDANKFETCGDCPRDYIAGAWDARRKYIEERSQMTDLELHEEPLDIRDASLEDLQQIVGAVLDRLHLRAIVAETPYYQTPHYRVIRVEPTND